MSPLEYPVWQKTYQEALLELDLQKLPERVSKAEMAIALRLQELKLSSNGHVERQALDDALRNLKILQREKPTSH
jgi:hypothetical protein